MLDETFGMKESNKSDISEKWIKAAIIGTGWAALEIVFGSFLHNLRIPFSGNILTGFGLIILISASYRWKENGLFWRAGIITALMKSLSPSAVIFGPMVAIFTEALLFDFSLRIFGRTLTGYIFGSVLAMTWVLFQRIFNLIIFYGSNLVDIYTNLMRMAENQLHVESDLVWLPIFLLLAVQILMGILAAVIGIKAGRKLVLNESISPIQHNPTPLATKQRKEDSFSYSLTWLWLNVFVIILTLILHSKTSWFVWLPLTVFMVTIWSIRYKSALRHLKKPKFWIFFFLITLLAAVTFSSLNDSETVIDGLLIGLQMNFRAVIVIIGFSVIGKELYNPKVVGFFQKSAYSQLHLALELSFSSVPQVIESLPGFREFVKNPLDGVNHLVRDAEQRIELLQKQSNSKPSIFIITGEIGQGKSNLCLEMYSKLKMSNVSVGGVISKRLMKKAQFVGYELLALSNQQRFPLMKFKEESTQDGIGRFTINNETIAIGNKQILEDAVHCQFLIIDEVGNLELKDRGWATSLKSLFSDYQGDILLSVRQNTVNEVIKKWNLTNYEVFDLKDFSFSEIANRIETRIRT